MTGYGVGKGKPPLHGQFRKGQSGNPMGRPKKAKPAPMPAADMDIARMIVKDGQRPVGVIVDGKSAMLPMVEAIQRKRGIVAASGHRLGAKEYIADYRAAEATIRQEESERYIFWRDYIARHRDAPLNWPHQDGVKPLYPHPRDIILDPIARKVHFMGPMNADIAPYYLLAAYSRDHMLILAEQNGRKAGIDSSSYRQMLNAAVMLHGTLAPSYGGPRVDEPDDPMPLMARMTTYQRMGKRELARAEREISRAIDRAPPPDISARVEQKQKADDFIRKLLCAQMESLAHILQHEEKHGKPDRDQVNAIVEKTVREIFRQ
ncbi:DUF5681 domain-containing protein [Sphingopyxis alaskensis]|uniref:DUF5681 domain-containing protein n=1 Tax=Sphingopyxis alaskensis TaxID=117207 RepID=UPI00391DF6EB